jgi:hypothetical protein
MKRLFQLFAAATAAAGMILLVATPLPQASASCTGAQCAQEGANKVNTGGTKTSTLDSAIKTVVNTILFLLGVVAVIVIVIGGFKYVTSNGDAEKVKSAKNTILYAVIGLVVAIMAYAIVDFVIGAFV